MAEQHKIGSVTITDHDTVYAIGKSARLRPNKTRLIVPIQGSDESRLIRSHIHTWTKQLEIVCDGHGDFATAETKAWSIIAEIEAAEAGTAKTYVEQHANSSVSRTWAILGGDYELTEAQDYGAGVVTLSITLTLSGTFT